MLWCTACCGVLRAVVLCAVVLFAVVYCLLWCAPCCGSLRSEISSCNSPFYLAFKLISRIYTCGHTEKAQPHGVGLYLNTVVFINVFIYTSMFMNLNDF